MLINILDALNEVLTLDDEESDELRRSDSAGTACGEHHVLVEELVCYFLGIVDLAYGDECKASEVRVHQQRLCVRVRDDADALLAEELRQLVLKLCAEIRACKVVDGTLEAACLTTVGCHTSTLGAEV